MQPPLLMITPSLDSVISCPHPVSILESTAPASFIYSFPIHHFAPPMLLPILPLPFISGPVRP